MLVEVQHAWQRWLEQVSLALLWQLRHSGMAAASSMAVCRLSSRRSVESMAASSLALRRSVSSDLEVGKAWGESESGGCEDGEDEEEDEVEEEASAAFNGDWAG